MIVPFFFESGRSKKKTGKKKTTGYFHCRSVFTGCFLKKKATKKPAHYYSKFYATTYIKAVYQIDIKYNVKYGTNTVRFCTRGAII